MGGFGFGSGFYGQYAPTGAAPVDTRDAESILLVGLYDAALFQEGVYDDVLILRGAYDAALFLEGVYDDVLILRGAYDAALPMTGEL